MPDWTAISTWAAVEHVHEGVRHIHIVAPRIELTSGKAMNIAPPGWQSLFDPLRDKWNAERGWRSPADPELARDLQPGQQIRAPEWGKGDDPRQVITAWLSDLAAAGHVSDRADIVERLATLGEVTRQGKDYVSVRLDGESKPVRLKGTMYAEGWSATEAVREAEAADRGRSRGRKEPDPAAAERARRSLEEGAARTTQRTTEAVTADHLNQLQQLQSRHMQMLRGMLWLAPLVTVLLCGLMLAGTWYMTERMIESAKSRRIAEIQAIDAQYCQQRPGACQRPPDQNQQRR